jgi:hypothetical protein
MSNVELLYNIDYHSLHVKHIYIYTINNHKDRPVYTILISINIYTTSDKP